MNIVDEFTIASKSLTKRPLNIAKINWLQNVVERSDVCKKGVVGKFL